MSNRPSLEILFSSSSEELFETISLTTEGRRAIEERVRERSSSESGEVTRTSAPWSTEVVELVDAVAGGADSVTGADIDHLRGALTDREIYEIVVTAAIAAGRRRLKVAPSIVANADAVPRFQAA